jgi:hypothetical protein
MLLWLAWVLERAHGDTFTTRLTRSRESFSVYQTNTNQDARNEPSIGVFYFAEPEQSGCAPSQPAPLSPFPLLVNLLTIS